MLYSHTIQLYNTYINISGNIVNNNDDFNERTNTLLYKNIPLTLYSKGLVLVVCERWVGDGDRLLHIDPKFFWLSSTSSHPGWATQPWVTESPSPLQAVLMLASCPQLTPTATGTELKLTLTQAACGTWLYNCLTSTCFLWAYASAPNSTTSTGQGDIPISSTGCTCFAVLLIYTGASLDWRHGRGSISYTECILYVKSKKDLKSYSYFFF